MTARWFALGCCILFVGCAENPAGIDYAFQQEPHRFTLLENEQALFQVEVLKWHDGRQAAVSLTLDGAWGTHRDHHLASDEVMAREMAMDIEMVTAIYQQSKNRPLLQQMRRELMPHGIHFYGHGHEHIDHDSLSFEEALASFRRCFNLMTAWGLRPRAYAYPSSAGYETATQLANRQAGFICARGSSIKPAEFSICPNDTTEPANWYYLPSVVMAEEESINYVNSHRELEPILADALERRAWVILMYHAVGIPEGWGYYPLSEFARDLDYIKERDFWSANLDMAAAYIQERNAFALEITRVEQRKGRRSYELVFADGLDNEVYDQLLTLEFRFDPGLKVRSVHFEPPLGGQADFAVADTTVRLNILPDEQTYRMALR